jgi:hypothetical protein
MSLSGTRGLVRVSANPQCEIQAAMAVENVREPEFYRRVTGLDYPREYGERLSARRRGTKFEANLHQNDAALLRKALAPLYGYDAEDIRVRNFEDELPGARNSIARLSRMRRVLADLADGRNVPHLLIQPQLALPVLTNRKVTLIGPDFMILDLSAGIYVPGDEKSFIVRDGVADSADLRLSRRQVAAQVLALRSEARRVGLSERVRDRGAFVLATPFGLAPAPAFEDSLAGEVVAIQRAIVVLQSAGERLSELRRPLGLVALENLFDELRPNYQESCAGTCVMADLCRSRCASQAITLGDRAADVVGADFDADRVVALAAGAAPANVREAEVAETLRDATEVLGIDPVELRRLIA